MKKFISKIEALCLYLSGSDNITVLNNQDDSVMDFCDILMSDYRDFDEMQFMIEDKEPIAEETITVEKLRTYFEKFGKFMKA